jgi:hypothetical protein
MTLKEDIWDYVQRTDYVSFAELDRRFGETYEMDGDYGIELGALPNAWVWSGMSEEYAQAIIELRNEGRIQYESASELVYFFDGGMLQMPIARRLRKDGYMQPRWLPVTIRPASKCAKANR